MNYLFLVKDLDSATGQCVKSVAEVIFQNNHNVYILTKVSNLSDYKGIKIITVDDNKIKTKINKKHILLNLFFRLKVVLLYPIWPLTSITFYKKMYNKTLEVLNKHDIHVVVSVYNSVETLMIGHKLKKIFKNKLIYVPYFLDALYAGQKPRFMSSKMMKRKALNTEYKYISNADGIIMMAPAKKAYLKDNIYPNYLNKTYFLDLPLYKPLQKEIVETNANKAEIMFFFAGSMPRNIRNPQVFLDIFIKLNANCHLYIAGNSDYQNIIEKYSSSCNRIHVLGMLNRDEVNDYMQRSDVLVNIGNSLSYMVPSKIFEYMSLKKCILSTYRIDDDPCITYLTQYGQSVLIDERDELEFNVNKIDSFILNNIVNKVVVDIDETLFYNNTPRAFYDVMVKICKQ